MADGKVTIECELVMSSNTLKKNIDQLSVQMNFAKKNINRLQKEIKSLDAEKDPDKFANLTENLKEAKSNLKELASQYKSYFSELESMGLVTSEKLGKMFAANLSNPKVMTPDIQSLVDSGKIDANMLDRFDTLSRKAFDNDANANSRFIDFSAIYDEQSKVKAEMDAITESMKFTGREGAKLEREAKGRITGTLGLLGMINPSFTRLSYALRQFTRLGKFSFAELDDKINKFKVSAKTVANLNIFDAFKGLKSVAPKVFNPLLEKMYVFQGTLLDLVNLDKGIRADAWADIGKAVSPLVTKYHELEDTALGFFSLDPEVRASSWSKMGNALSSVAKKAGNGFKTLGKIGVSSLKSLAKQVLSVKGLVISLTVGIAGMVASIKLVMSATKKLFGIARSVGTAFANFYDFDKYFGSLDTMMEAYNEMQTKETALEGLMRSRMGATDDNVEAIHRLVSAEQESGVISRQLQVSSLQQLSAYVTETQTLETLLPVMNDYTAQMYGINASEKQAESTAKLFGKAMKGQTETLRRSGYVTEAQAKAIKNAGSETERAALLAQYMGERCKNMNDILAQTDAGQQHKLANSMQEVQREFGQAASVLKTTFMPVATAVLAVMARMASYAAAMAQSIAKFFGRSLASAAATSEKIEDVATATDNASSAAQKAEDKKLGYYDELNVIDDKSDSGAGGGAGGVVDPATTEQDTSLIDGLSNSLDEMLAKLGSAYDLGLLFGTKMKEALESIPWDKIKDGATKAGTAIAEFFNGIIDSGFIEQLGTTIAEGINTVANFLLAFIDTFDFASYGRALANGLENMITTIDWGNLGKLIGDALIGLFDFVNNFLESFDWSTFGRAIADFLCGVDWLGLLGEVVEFAINALALILVDLPVLILTFLHELIMNIINGITKYVQDTMKEQGVLVVGALLIGIVDALKNIVQWVWDHVAVPIIMAFAKYFGVDSDNFSEKGDEMIQGLFNGIIDAMASIFRWVKEHIFDPIINAIKRLFGIHSPSTVFAKLGKFMIQGLKNGMSGLWVLVSGIWTSLKTNVSAVIQALVNDVKAKFNVLKDGLTFIVAIIAGSVGNAFSNMKNNIISIFTTVKDTVLSIWINMWNGIKFAINIIIGGINGFINAIVNGLNTVIGALNRIHITAPRWMTSKFGIGSLGFNIPRVSGISIPMLASGAVLPANNPFLAVVGDQKSGTNVETPLSTMIEAFNSALDSRSGSNNAPIVLQLNGKQIAQVVWDENEKRYKQTGNPRFA